MLAAIDWSLASLEALAARLEELDAPAGLLIVGGSFMALHGLRGSTHDIDTVNHISDAIRAAVEEVARPRGFQPTWRKVGTETAALRVVVRNRGVRAADQAVLEYPESAGSSRNAAASRT